jgi:magnesium transporter
MSYPPDSAGGMMSSEYLPLSQDLTVAAAISSIQEQDEQSVAFYIYITDEEARLVGVLSLKQLLLSKPSMVLRDIMIRDIISVNTETNQMEVANLVERYDFLSIPVVDAQFRLVGVITVDDVIDVIRAEAQEDILAMGQVSTGSDDFSLRGHLKSRLPWLGFTFVGGAVCALIVEAFVPAMDKEPYWALVAFLPMLLALTSTAGNQAAAVTVEAIISGRISTKDTVEHLIHEMKVAAVIGLLFAFLMYGLSLTVRSPADLGGFISSVLAVQIFVAMFLGTLIPLSLRKLNLDPTVSTVSIFAIISNIMCVFVLFGIAYRFFYPMDL